MFIRRSDYLRLIEERDRAAGNAAIERAKTELLDRQVTQQHTFLTFLCSRVNALEKERAALFQKVSGVELPTPTIVAAAPPRHDNTPPSIDEVLGPMGAVFEDMGEAEAQRNGVGWDRDGRVVRKADEKR